MSMSKTLTSRPFVKWAGGKRQLLQQLVVHCPIDWNRYWEPFIGGGALFFFLTKPVPEFSDVLSDVNYKLIDTYRAVRDYPLELMEELEKHKRKHNQDYYYKLRGKNSSVLVVEEAARFIYLNKMGFNGLYRVNQSGQFNVPLGGDRSTDAIYNPEELLLAANQLTDTELVICDFGDITPREGDFVYCDPPYLATTKMYGPEQFTQADHERLRDTAIYWHNKGVYVMISERDSEFIRDLYSPFPLFTVNEIKSKSTISATSKGRGLMRELIITTYE